MRLRRRRATNSEHDASRPKPSRPLETPDGSNRIDILSKRDRMARGDVDAAGDSRARTRFAPVRRSGLSN
eukprot:scaffold867_cov317-Pavlova_lutheri.AAC.6